MTHIAPETPVFEAASARLRTVADALSALLSLAKPRVAAMVVLSTVIPFTLASGPARGMLLTGIATTLLAAGIFALNQFLERDVDERMGRTRRRALPSGRLAPGAALAFGTGSVLLALALLASALPPLSAAVGLFTAVSYLFVYTPLKRTTAWHTAIGALPGATPPLLGWAAATGTLPVDAWVLAAILFLWQFPHFIAIEMIYRDDYARAGLKVVPAVDLRGSLTRWHVVAPLVLLLPVSVLPAVTGLTRPAYAAAAAAASILFLASGLRSLAREGGAQRELLRASVVYLPLIFGLLLLLRS